MDNPAPEHILRTIELYEDDEVCDSPIIGLETGLDRAEVDEVLQYLRRADRIECRAMKASDGSEILTGISSEGKRAALREWGALVRATWESP